MANDRILLVLRNVIGAHPGKKIVGMIVGADVIKAKLPILALAQPPFRRAMGSRGFAVRPFAGGTLGAKHPILVGLHPDTIEQRGVDFHNPSICAQRELSGKSRQHGDRPSLSLASSLDERIALP